MVEDKDRVRAGYPDLHQVLQVDVHDVVSRCATASTGDGRGRAGKRFQADPCYAGAGTM